MNKLLSAIAFIGAALLCTSPLHAQQEQQLRAEIQKKLGANAKVKSVSPAPVSGLYEVLVGNDIFYTDTSGKYLIQGEIIELASGKNITEQRQTDLNRIKWSDLTPANAIKNVRGNGSRQLAVFSDPNCGYCKRLEKSLQQLDNITIYTYLIPILSPDSTQKAKQIWCSSDPYKTYIDWMVNGIAPSGKGECSTPLDKNMAFAKTYGITGTPTLFFTDGSRFPGAVQINDIEKKFSSLK
ncbi:MULTISPECIES: DsbC family protein [unclassified Polynucleobacter]|uniref:DsbC family protein n=1 Tax=unclassified Polynucleobacter TaxID=2640945 RepID=UPI001C0D6137|nr:MULTISPECIES: DsbC family protein [unclassified Polynucleobacter]MBU3547671.1 DsbC family protein [Polynucleobacter sp. P1-05-14]MBU3638356.1 DsbC family protein [Polynucleobacter sp. AP-RePozz3-80-G7]